MLPSVFQPQVVLDRSSPVPLYFQVAEQLERAIRDGDLVAGDRIANEVAWADQLGVSRPTMRQAIQLLVDKGMLVRKRGVGTQVVQAPIRRTVELTSLYDDLRRTGHHTTTDVLDLALVPADEGPATRLGCPVGTPVWRLERVRRVDGQPLALMRNHVPASVTDLGDVDFTATGLYELFRTRAIHLRVAHQTICARLADRRESRLLGVKVADALLTMERTSYDDSGRAVEHADHLYRPDLYSYETTLVDR
ncbi:GntR family transcriptional regulator [Nocardioides sp. HDW12B]|nr:GntR family transcriptional regulator [Nocardioides sp. HDW12B]